LIPICIESFYLMFFIMMLMKDLLIFVAIKYSTGDIKQMTMLMVMFDMIILFTLPLMMLITKGACI